MSRVLVTGGAGFIGSLLVKRLAAKGHDVLVLDNLHPQVHGKAARPPDFPERVAFKLGSIEDREAVRSVLRSGPLDVVFHLAAETGTGQSHDEMVRYCEVNVVGTAVLMEELKRVVAGPCRIVLAGSRAVYGEGAYRKSDGTVVVAEPRSVERLRAGDFMPRDLEEGPLHPVATKETLPPAPSSIYASTKLMQEQLLLQGLAGTTIQPVLLRFQNVYGPGQSLRNPYTGVLSIFCTQILNGEMLNIFEDGNIVRDFVFVDDVVDALVRAGESEKVDSRPINVGSGRALTILDAARRLLDLLGMPTSTYRITGQFRAGDVRHAVADISRAARLLDWHPATRIEDGLAALAVWARKEHETALQSLAS